MSTLANQPAFPTPAGHATIKDYHAGHGEFLRTVEICTTGMTLRQHYAGLAMQGLASLAIVAIGGGECTLKDTAKAAVKMADALIAELEKPTQPTSQP